MSSSELRPLRRDAERNRHLIVGAARVLFAERGLDVSMDEIARHAGVGVGTVYRRFPEKELLIDALFDDRLETIVGIAADSLELDDPWEALTYFMERYVSVQAEDRGLRQLLFSSAHAEDRVARARGRIKPITDELLRRAHAAGELRPDATGTDIALLQFMLSALVDYTRDVDPVAWRRFLGIVLDGLRARRDGPTALEPGPLDDAAFSAVLRAWKSR